MGTAEIYSVVEKFEEIKESVVIGQSWNNDTRIILFIVLNQGYKLNDKIKNKIKKAIKSDASPRHVPSKIISILDIPKTKNGKLVELAVKQTVEGEPIKNLEALAKIEDAQDLLTKTVSYSDKSIWRVLSPYYPITNPQVSAWLST